MANGVYIEKGRGSCVKFIEKNRAICRAICSPPCTASTLDHWWWKTRGFFGSILPSGRRRPVGCCRPTWSCPWLRTPTPNQWGCRSNDIGLQQERRPAPLPNSHKFWTNELTRTSYSSVNHRQKTRCFVYAVWVPELPHYGGVQVNKVLWTIQAHPPSKTIRPPK